jgi:hypothetical protein
MLPRPKPPKFYVSSVIQINPSSLSIILQNRDNSRGRLDLVFASLRKDLALL